VQHDFLEYTQKSRKEKERETNRNPGNISKYCIAIFSATCYFFEIVLIIRTPDMFFFESSHDVSNRQNKYIIDINRLRQARWPWINLTCFALGCVVTQNRWPNCFPPCCHGLEIGNHHPTHPNTSILKSFCAGSMTI